MAMHDIRSAVFNNTCPPHIAFDRPTSRPPTRPKSHALSRPAASPASHDCDHRLQWLARAPNYRPCSGARAHNYRLQVLHRRCAAAVSRRRRSLGLAAPRRPRRCHSINYGGRTAADTDKWCVGGRTIGDTCSGVCRPHEL